MVLEYLVPYGDHIINLKQYSNIKRREHELLESWSKARETVGSQTRTAKPITLINLIAAHSDNLA